MSHSQITRPYWSFLIVVGAVFFGEFLVMVLLPYLLPENFDETAKALIDSSLLTLVILPVLSTQVVRPLGDLAALRSELLQRVYDRQEEERRRIALDLHDDIGQMLTTILLGLKTAAQADTVDAIRDRLAELTPRVAATIEGVRRISAGLRPAVLDDLGLEPALERLAAELSSSTTLQASFTSTSFADSRVPTAVETTIFRIVQESLQNVVRHAEASKVSIRLEQSRDSVTCEVVDNGRGFDMSAVRSPLRSRIGLGLTGMRERVELVGGRITVTSRPQRGTRILVTIPVPCTVQPA